MTNIVEEFLGINENEPLEIKPSEKEQALAIVKLLQVPEWKVFEAFLLKSLDNCNQPCEVYALNPDLAKIDLGKKNQIALIQQFLDTQTKLIEQYVEEKTNSLQ